jgi:hypothetical protein
LQQSIDAINSLTNRFAVLRLRLQLEHIYPAAVPTIIKCVQLVKHIFDRRSGIQIGRDTITDEARVCKIVSVQKLFRRLIKYPQCLKKNTVNR